jgi:hypothetical protein
MMSKRLKVHTTAAEDKLRNESELNKFAHSITEKGNKLTKINRQRVFLDSFIKNFGNISIACKSAGISRATYYAWINGASEADVKFRADLQNVEPEEVFVDFLESKLVQLINGGDTAATIFGLKAKGKRRGWVERTEHVEFNFTNWTINQFETFERLINENTPEEIAYRTVLAIPVSTGEGEGDRGGEGTGGGRIG